MIRRMTAVCRTEIADCVEGAFGHGTLSPTDLVKYATDHGARSPVLKVLERLHEPIYREIRDLWGELGDIPVEA